MRLAKKEKKKNFSPEIRLSLTLARKFRKKKQKIKKPLSDIIFSHTGMGLAEKESKNSSAEFRSYSDRGKKFRKKFKK